MNMIEILVLSSRNNPFGFERYVLTGYVAMGPHLALLLTGTI